MPFQQYLDLAVAESPTLIARSITQAVRSMAQASVTVTDQVERNRLANTAEALQKAAQATTEAFPAALRREFEAASSTTASPAKTLSFDSLELMAEDQLDDAVELLRGEQAVKAAVEADLVALNALVSAAQGHERVTTIANPLRPEIWVRAFHRALEQAKAPAAARASWMLHVGRALGPELATLYRSLAKAMTQEGISAATYKITPQDETRRRVTGDASGPTLRDLKRLLANVARGDSSTQGLTRPAGQTMNGMTVPAAMEALQGMKQADDVVRRMQDRWRKGAWQAETAAPGESAAADGNYTPAQTLAREVARLMIANVAADQRLLPDVQEAVRELEPALLRLVLSDQRFFVERQHPARQLLEEMTRRSLAWPQRNSPGFLEFFAPLRDAVQMLAQMPLENEEPFHYALQMLRQSWDEAAERSRRQRASMARTLIKADARNHAATGFATRLAERPDVAAAPADVRRFILGPWCQVMAAARLAAAPGEKDPGGYGALVDQIVGNPGPQLMQALQAALAGIGYTQEQSREVLQFTQGAQATAGATVQWGDTAPWLSPEELGESRLGQSLEAAPATAFLSTQQGVPGADELLPGQYIEVQVQGAWRRWRLTWASPHGLMLMFVDAGGKPESMTRQMLDKMLEMGAIRLLASGSVVDGALDAVAQAALEKSTQMPE